MGHFNKSIWQLTRCRAPFARRFPLKVAQRQSSSKIEDLGLQDLRIYNRVLDAGEIAQLATATRAAYLVGLPSEGRSPLGD